MESAADSGGRHRGVAWWAANVDRALGTCSPWNFSRYSERCADIGCLILALTVVGGAGRRRFRRVRASRTTKSRTFYKATTTLVVDLTQPAHRRLGHAERASRASTRSPSTPRPARCPTWWPRSSGPTRAAVELAEHIITHDQQQHLDDRHHRRRSRPPTRPRQVGRHVRGPSSSRTSTSRDRTRTPGPRSASRRRLDDITKKKNALVRADSPPTLPNVDKIQVAVLTALTNQYRITYDSYSSARGSGSTDEPVLRPSRRPKPVPIDKAEYDARPEPRRHRRATTSPPTTVRPPTRRTADTIISTSSSSPDQAARCPAACWARSSVCSSAVGLAVRAGALRPADPAPGPRPKAAFTLPGARRRPRRSPRSNSATARSSPRLAPLSRVAEALPAIRSSLLFTRAAMAAAEAGRNDSCRRNGTTVPRPGGTPVRARRTTSRSW